MGVVITCNSIDHEQGQPAAEGEHIGCKPSGKKLRQNRKNHSHPIYDNIVTNSDYILSIVSVIIMKGSPEKCFLL